MLKSGADFGHITTIRGDGLGQVTRRCASGSGTRLGGCRTPLIVKWPLGDLVQWTDSDQFCHVIDLMPTLLEACGIRQPDEVDGISQEPFDGKSILRTFDDPTAPSPRTTQYFEMLGSRSIVHNGWKATTDHVLQGVVDEEQLMTGSRNFASDHWGLFRLDDFSESEDISDQHPDVVKVLEEVWMAEAVKNQVLPLSEGLISRTRALIPAEYPPASRRTFFPGAVVSDEAMPFLAGGFSIEVDTEVLEGETNAVLCALGDWNGGFSLYLKDSHLAFALRPAGGLASVKSGERIPSGDHVLGVGCRPTSDGITLEVTCDGEAVGSSTSPLSIPFTFQHGGTQLRIGFDNEFPVVDTYTPPARWSGRIRQVVVDGTSPRGSLSTQEMAGVLRND